MERKCQLIVSRDTPTLTECITRYFFYALDVLTLEDRPGYPILIDGHPADNVGLPPKIIEYFT